MNKQERKRLRKGVSMSKLQPIECEGIARANLESALIEARSLSLNLYRTRPGDTAWVYRFSVPNTPVAWVGVRFSERPESGAIQDDDRFINLEPIIGYHNGERLSPEVCTAVHGLENISGYGEKNPGSNPWYSEELVERWRAFFRKEHSSH